ncbi:MAG TPA: hypothetical protein VJ946_04300 [Bacteroidales bacterium]|nr:hypothetical protein [Bacteroidales bacterium]
MNFVRKLFFIALALFLFNDASAQTDAAEFYSKHLQIQNTGMYILGSWAIANIGAGAYGWNRYDGDAKYFHQMNLFWNTVNLGIAGFALHNNLQLDPLAFGSDEALDEVRNIEKILLINSGLDVGYIGAGFLLKHLSSNSENRKDLLTGYGNSLILQGSFLLVFDLILYGVLHSQRMDFMESISLSLGEDHLGLRWCYRF